MLSLKISEDTYPLSFAVSEIFLEKFGNCDGSVKYVAEI